MSIMKDEIEEHMKENMIIEESQAGFTEVQRIEDNIFVLQYCVEKFKKN